MVSAHPLPGVTGSQGTTQDARQEISDVEARLEHRAVAIEAFVAEAALQVAHVLHDALGLHVRLGSSGDFLSESRSPIAQGPDLGDKVVVCSRRGSHRVVEQRCHVLLLQLCRQRSQRLLRVFVLARVDSGKFVQHGCVGLLGARMTEAP